MLVAIGAATGAFLLATATEPDDTVRYRKADADGDGRISRSEYLGSMKEKGAWWPMGEASARTGQNALTPEMFNALDRNRDGYLSTEEIESGRRLRESRGDDGSGASRSRDVNPPGTQESSSKSVTPVESAEARKGKN